MTTYRRAEDLYEQLVMQLRGLLRDASPTHDALLAVCHLLRTHVSHYDWVGVYLRDPGGRDELVLGPFDGAPTEHTRIPFGTGVCGRAAERAETVLVQDVSRDPDYQACSLDVKSELVVPILKEGRFVALIDVDSHTPSAFTDADRTFLEIVAEMLSAFF